MSYKVYKLDPRKLSNTGVFVFVGRRKSGKTILMRDILYHKRNVFKKVLVMTSNEDTVKDFAQHVPELFIRKGFDPHLLEQIKAKQEHDVRRGICKPLLIVLDDLGFAAKSIQKAPVIKELFMNGRHFNISLMFSMQYCKAFEPDLRSQIDYIFLAFEKNPQNRARIFEAFNTIFETKREFDHVMRSCTQNYEFMVMNNESASSDLVSDNIFWYKAQYPMPAFKVNNGGSMWRYAAQRFDPGYYMRTDGNAQDAKEDAKKGVLTIQKTNKHRRV